MKLNRLSIYAVASLIAISSCVAEDPTNKQGAENTDDIIKFGLSSSVETKTVYDSGNKYQINWVANDEITIYSPQAQTTGGSVNRATYVVTPITDNEKNGSIAPQSSTAALKWGAETLHDFYAVYPAVDGITIQEDGTMFLPASHSQFVQLQPKVGNNYPTTPDMKNAYMVAHSQVDRTTGTVSLNFKPIMTTLEITVNGKSANANGQPNQEVVLTGISVSYNLPSDSQTTHMKINGKTGDLVMQGTSTSYTQQEALYVGLKTGDNNDYVRLADGESVTFTVFIPAFEINKDKPIKVRVHAAGATEVSLTLPKAEGASIAKRSKVAINLPSYPTSPTIGNNWITPLNGSIYVSQLSIPGSHDAATGETMASIFGDLFAQTQMTNINTQWSLGVRAFDLRPAIYTGASGNPLWLWHGVTRVSVAWDTALGNIKSLLVDNPGEFAIVLFRHENENVELFGASLINKDSDNGHFNDAMKRWVDNNKSWIVNWRPDITIDECRGKVILISRFEQGTWEYGCYTGWNHDEGGAIATIRNYNNTVSGTANVQDYYNPANHQRKFATIKNHLDISATFHTVDALKNRWMINHLSGYTGTTSSSSYANNAAYQNPNVVQYLNNRTNHGSTGILLFDYSGVAKYNSTQVDGDVVLQTVIDNNYKYRMRRRGDNQTNN